MKIKSSSFKHDESIPQDYACDGRNISPPLQFSDIPQGAKSLCLVMADQDAPGGGYVHWLVWNIPPSTTSIEEGKDPSGVNGRTDFAKKGYSGPCPRRMVHRYSFKLYALDTMLNLPEGSDRSDLEQAMKGHVLEEADLIGKFGGSPVAMAGPKRIIAFGVYFVLLFLVSITLLVDLWPLTEQVNLTNTTSSSEGEQEEEKMFFGLVDMPSSGESAVIMIAGLAGLLGSLVATAQSFVSYVGNRKFAISWSSWYVFRPMIGMSLAIIVYFAFRGGLFSAQEADVSDVNVFGIAALAGLTGLFSRSALDKLKEIFDNIFGTKEEKKRSDKLTPATEEEG